MLVLLHGNSHPPLDGQRPSEGLKPNVDFHLGKSIQIEPIIIMLRNNLNCILFGLAESAY
jgi:hypothetical protein